jgi:hypothetical protein
MCFFGQALRFSQRRDFADNPSFVDDYRRDGIKFIGNGSFQGTAL